jgi:hypothetical protein
MYQLRKNAPVIRRATSVAVLFGLVAWVGLLIGAEATQSPAALHIAGAALQGNRFHSINRIRLGMNDVHSTERAIKSIAGSS